MYIQCHRRNVHYRSYVYGQVASFKRICSIEFTGLEQLKQWLVKLGCKKDRFDKENFSFSKTRQKS